MTEIAENPARTRLGIIQSRGLGDIAIALPIARWYWERGHDIVWPICEPFVASFKDTVPWVKWIPVPVDPQGLFFLDTPMKLLADEGITSEDDILYLYQYLSSVPERTDPDLFAMMKFDQYKYAAAGVPFGEKWRLDQCITRNPAREAELRSRLLGDHEGAYCVYQGRASDVVYEVDLSVLPEGVKAIEIREDHTESIFDWLGLIDGADHLILVDSVFANLVDQLDLCPQGDRYFMRKWNRRVDGNPVFLGSWSYIPVEAPPGVTVQSLAENPARGQAAAPQAEAAAGMSRPNGSSSGQTYTPFGQSRGTMPTSFLGATKQGQSRPGTPIPSGNRMGGGEPQKPNSAQQLLASLGLRQ